MDVGERGELEDERLGSAGEAGDSRGDHEGDQLVVIRLVPERNRPRLVLADGGQHLAERRVDGAVEQGEAEQEDRRDDVVHRDRMSAQLEETEEPPARHGLDPVLAAGERRAQAEEVEHLRQRERDHGEVDPLPPDGDRADDEAQSRSAERGAEDGELGRPAPNLRRVRRGVARARTRAAPRIRAAD